MLKLYQEVVEVPRLNSGRCKCSKKQEIINLMLKVSESCNFYHQKVVNVKSMKEVEMLKASAMTQEVLDGKATESKRRIIHEQVAWSNIIVF